MPQREVLPTCPDPFAPLDGLVGYSGRSSEGHILSLGVSAVTKLCDYVKTSEAAEILGVSINTIRTWAAAGKIRVARNPANGYRLFRRDDLKKFLSRAARPERAVRINRPR